MRAPSHQARELKNKIQTAFSVQRISAYFFLIQVTSKILWICFFHKRKIFKGAKCYRICVPYLVFIYNQACQPFLDGQWTAVCSQKEGILSAVAHEMLRVRGWSVESGDRGC